MTTAIRVTFLLTIYTCMLGCNRQTANGYSHPGKPKNYKGEWDKFYEWKSSKKKVYANEIQRKVIIDSFNKIPNNLGIVEEALDSTVLTTMCFKFVYSPDSTKFIAFYLTPYQSKEHKFITRNGGTTSYHDYEYGLLMCWNL